MILHLPFRAQNLVAHLYPEIRIFEFLLLRRSQHLPKNFLGPLGPSSFPNGIFEFYRKRTQVTGMKNLVEPKNDDINPHPVGI